MILGDLLEQVHVGLLDPADIDLLRDLANALAFKIRDFLGQGFVFLCQVNDLLLFLRLLVQPVKVRIQHVKCRICGVKRADQCADPGNEHADTGRDSQDDSEARDRCGKQRVRGCRQLRDSGVSHNRRRGQTEHADKGGNALHQRRVCFDEFSHRLQETRQAFGNGRDHGRNRVTDGDLHVVRGVLQHGQLGFRGVVHHAGLFAQSCVLFPCAVRLVDRVRQQVTGRCKAEDGLGLPYILDAQLIQDNHGASSVALRVVQSLDELIHRPDSVLAPGLFELLRAHSGNGSEFIQLVPGLRGLVQGGDQGRHGRGSGSGLDTEGTDSRGDCQDVAFAHACL